jgi:hypothetical protein
MRTPVPAVLVAALLAVLGTGCTARSEPAPEPQALRLVASVTQFRFDEGTRNLKAGVTNDGHGDIRVSRATIAWSAFAFPTLDLPDDAVHPGQTAAFSIAYGEARCATRPTTRPVLVAVVNGRTLRLPLRVEDPGLLLRLHTKDCARQRLDRAADFGFRVARHTERLSGTEYLPADIVLRRRGGATERVRVVDLDGSVLVDVLPRGGPRSLPGDLPPGRRTLTFPVLLGSAHRCDAHALGQSSQTFLLSVYLRLGDGAAQRVVLPLSPADRARLIGVVDRDCAGAHG